MCLPPSLGPPLNRRPFLRLSLQYPDVISEAEEAALLVAIEADPQPWGRSAFGGNYLAKRWGRQVDRAAQRLSPVMRPLPDFVMSLLPRLLAR